MKQPFQLALTHQHSTPAIQVNYPGEIPLALQTLMLPASRPVIVVVGGASGLQQEHMDCVRSLFADVLAPLAESLQACVVDGGTNSGIMQLMGQAHAETGATFPLIGVAAVGTVILPNLHPLIDDAAPLEPNHTHFVLVPGRAWGDESPWIAQVAKVLSLNASSVTVLINGGKIAWMDVTNSIKSGRPVVVLAGSGRTADTLANMLRHKSEANPTVARLTHSDLLHVVDLDQGLEAIAQCLGEMLEGTVGGG